MTNEPQRTSAGRLGSRKEGTSSLPRRPGTQASWQFACLFNTIIIIYRKMHTCSVKKIIIIINAPYSSANFSVFVTEVLELRTFLFDLHVLISIASVQTPPPLKKKKKTIGERAWTLQLFSRRGGFCTLAIIRDFKMPRWLRQRQRQKSNRLNRQNNSARFFVHFFSVTSRLRRENA